MDYALTTGYEPCTLMVTIRSLTLCCIRLQVLDKQKRDTVFADDIYSVRAGQEVALQVPMPLSPRTAIVKVYDIQYGNRSAGRESSFRLLKIEKVGLRRFLQAIDLTPQLQTFIDFIQRFSYNAGTLPTNPPGNAYCSRDLQSTFKLKYLPALFDPKTGQIALTPARMETATKIFEVSKPKFLPKTVPARVCILTHEGGHHFINADPDDELEADLNGLSIYLALGYSPNTAIETYRDTFRQVPTPDNLFHRLKPVEEFIAEFYKEFDHKKSEV